MANPDERDLAPLAPTDVVETTPGSPVAPSLFIPLSQLLAEPDEPPKVARKKKPKRQSRGDRWLGAVGTAKDALEAIEAKMSELSAALEEIESVKSEYVDWRDNMSENLQGSGTYAKLEAICELEFDASEIESALGDLLSQLDEAESAELPLGFGRD